MKNKYLEIKRKSRQECQKAKADYLDRISEDKDNKKLFWNYVKSKKKDNVSCSQLKDKHGKPQSDPLTKANLLNDQFSSVWSDPTVVNHTFKDPDAPEIDNLNISTKGVHKLLINLKPFKATGPDGLPPFILKELAYELAPTFKLLFEASLCQGTLPTDWKSAFVTPIFKKGDPLLASNYRPVSLTSVPSKVMEHIVSSHIMKHLENHGILCDNQHGFRKFRSCESQLIATVEDIAKNLDNGNQTDMILLDFSKAFDKVNHTSLLAKLKHYGIQGQIHSWISCFLKERTQQVLLEGVSSSSSTVLSGVPQGTVLGPLLFLIYINDLPKFISPGTQLKLFADDSAIYRKITSQADHAILQHDLENLTLWEKEWSMQFHPDKCQLLSITNKKSPSTFTYTIHNTNIQPTTDAKYLGITLNNKLSWNTHIDNVCQKGNNTLNFMYRNFRTAGSKVKEQLYNTYVRPALEYSSSVWDPHTLDNINKIEKVQRRAARFTTNTYTRETSVTTLLQNLKWTPLSERRARAKSTLLYKALHGDIHIPIHNLNVTQAPTRQQQNFYIPFARTDMYKHSFYLDSIRLWNKIPTHIRCSPTLPLFQRQLLSVTLRHSY